MITLSDKFISQLKIVLGFVTAIVTATLSAAVYLNRYAEAVEHRLTTVEERSADLKDDVHWLRDQLGRIADRVGAERVPPPKH
jgi:uncharacterized protein involved in cysteine biosynthesis